jgi:hypothetical protein
MAPDKGRVKKIVILQVDSTFHGGMPNGLKHEIKQ